jgi:hypothetical protein
MNMTFQQSDVISVVIASAWNSVANSLAVASATVTVVKVTEKAIQVKSETETGKEISAWLPKKAIKVLGEKKKFPGAEYDYCTAEIARWFKGDAWTNTFFRLATKCY